MAFRRFVQKVTGKVAQRAYPAGRADGQGTTPTQQAPARVTTIKSDPIPPQVSDKPSLNFEQTMNRLALDKREAPLVSDQASAAASASRSRSGAIDDPRATVGERTAPATTGARRMPQSRGNVGMSDYIDNEQPGRLSAEQVEMLLLSPIARDPSGVVGRVASESEISEEALNVILQYYQLPPPPPPPRI
eukprot:m.123027 g.123027  ORF g.123027 m.123027 type:complete len:190 (+) comp21991_c0_seq1:73-642(+)